MRVKFLTIIRNAYYFEIGLGLQKSKEQDLFLISGE